MMIQVDISVDDGKSSNSVNLVEVGVAAGQSTSQEMLLMIKINFGLS